MNSEAQTTSQPAGPPPAAEQSRLRRPGAPRPHRMVALGLMLTAGAKLMFAAVFALMMIVLPDIDPGLGVASGAFAVYGFVELGLMRAAWRDRVGLKHAVAIAIGFALFAAAGFFAGLDPYTEGGFANLFSAIAAAYLLAAAGWIWGALRARDARSA